VSAAERPQNLPDAPDERETSRSLVEALQLSMFGRVGQLVLDVAGVPAQLGLDGLAYAPEPAPDSDRSPDRASQSLGTHTGFHNRAEPQSNPAQLALDLDAWEEAPQLSMWARLAVQRDLLSFGEWDRYAKCGWVRFKREADVGGKRRESGSWSATNVIRCGYPGCPWCGTTLAQSRAAQLGACMDRHLNSGDGDSDVWMLTPTIPHYATDSASVVVEQLYAAHSLFAKTREWRDFVKQWGLLGNGVRCLDATAGGGDGLHAHFHIALFATRAGLPTSEAWRLDLDDKAQVSQWLIPGDGIERFWAASVAENIDVLPLDLATQLRQFGIWRKLKHCPQRVRERYMQEIAAPLVVAWERCCDAVGVRIVNRDRFHRTALKLTPSENAASYFVGWMLADEVTQSVSKDRNPLRLLDAVKAGIKGAAFTYKQFRRAVDGRQWVTGITDLRRRLGVTDEDVQAYADERRRKRELELEREGNPVKKKRELNLLIRAHLFPAVHALGWDAVWAFVDATEERLTGDTYPPVEVLQRELDAFLWSHLGDRRSSRSDSDDVDERPASD